VPSTTQLTTLFRSELNRYFSSMDLGPVVPTFEFISRGRNRRKLRHRAQSWAFWPAAISPDEATLSYALSDNAGGRFCDCR